MKKRQGTKVPTIEERRIAVIKDAIKQVKQGKYTVLAANGYVCFRQDFGIDVETEGDNVQAKPLISGDKLQDGACEVCAKGALLVSQVRKENVLTISELENCDHRTSSTLRSLFGSANLDKVETEFEGDSGMIGDIIGDAEQRLLFILENMLKNKGVYKPESATLGEIAKYK